MTAVPLKPEYGPTLGQLLAPWWRGSSALVRRTVIAACTVLTVCVGALVLTLLNSTYSHGAPVPFSFSYRGLYSAARAPGEYVRIQQRNGRGALRYSLAVAPLTLPPYGGDESGELPLYASSYIAALRARYPGLVLRGEGKTRVNTVPAYDVLYTATVDGQRMYAKDIMLLPEREGARKGVLIKLLTAPGASRQIEGPMEVGTTGVLERPLRSFNISSG
jgi:hypothetical protein